MIYGLLKKLDLWRQRIVYFGSISVFVIIFGQVVSFLTTRQMRYVELLWYFREFKSRWSASLDDIDLIWKYVLLGSALLLLILIFGYAFGMKVLKISVVSVGLLYWFLHVFTPIEYFMVSHFETNFGELLLWCVIYVLIAFHAFVYVRLGTSIMYVMFTIMTLALLIGGGTFLWITDTKKLLFAVNVYWTEMKFSFDAIAFFTDYGMFAFLLLVAFINLFTLAKGIVFSHKRGKDMIGRTALDFDDLPPIGINIPAYNERAVIVPTVEAVLRATYPMNKKHILVICDGSKDGTPNVLIETYQMYEIPLDSYDPGFAVELIKTRPVTSIWQSPLYPNLRMIIKNNGHKHDALNVGLLYQPEIVHYVMNIDADTKIEESSLVMLASEISSDRSIAAVAGVIRPSYEPNKKRRSLLRSLKQSYSKALVKWQQIDYYSAFHISRGGMAHTNALMIVSGAFGLFDRNALIAAGGYTKGLGEDMAMTLQLQTLTKYYERHKHRGRIVFAPEAISFTAAPLTMTELSGQRKRWFKGMLECLQEYYMLAFTRRMFFAYLQFMVVETLTPLLIPLGIMMLFARPEMIHNLIFQISLALAIITSLLNSAVSIWIESKHRPIKKREYLYLPLQFFAFIFTVAWRNEALIQYKDKSWGSIVKRFN